jgi:hypothetical protein
MDVELYSKQTAIYFMVAYYQFKEAIGAFEYPDHDDISAIDAK